MLKLARAQAAVGKAPSACAHRDGARREGRSLLSNVVLGTGRAGRYHNAAFFHIDGQPIPTYWTQLPVRSELIVAWVGGPGAVALSGLSQAQARRNGARGLRELFGEVELARGSSRAASRTIGAATPLRAERTATSLSEWQRACRTCATRGRVAFFCWRSDVERWSRGTVNGAIETGERAAAQAVAALGVKEIA